MRVLSRQPELIATRATSSASRTWVAALALGIATLAAYHNSFSVPFLFDDIPAIQENRAIRQLWPIGSLFAPDQPGGLTTSGRPIVTLSLAINHAVSGNAVWSYHATNLLIHFCAGLCLLGIVRRTLLTQPARRDRPGAVALPLAFVVSALWMLHPLQTESATYVVQRAESLAGLFYLLTLYAFIRSTDSPRPRAWLAVAVCACAIGVGTKEVVATAPLIVYLYDRTFISGTFRAAWNGRRGFYLLLGATWILLALLIIRTGNRGGTAGFGTEMSAWTYALTQCRAIVHYVALGIWPNSLVFDYGLATARGLGEVLPQAFLIIASIAAVIVALRRSPVIGFLAACFFILLAPSSSFIPVVTQTMAEHRMYLPLAALMVGLVVGLHRFVGMRALPISGAAAVALLLATAGRNQDYRTEQSIWADAAAKLPTNARAHNNLGLALFHTGRIPDAIARYERALRLQPKYPETHYNLAVALAAQGHLPPAIEHYETALRLQPAYPEAHNNLGNALVRAGRMPDAIRHYHEAIAINPTFAEAYNNLGNALLQSNRAADAIVHFKRAIELKPDYAEASYNLGNAYAAMGAMKEALEQYGRALLAKADYAEAHVNAGNALLAIERPAEALSHYERAVALSPELADAHYNFGSALLELERWPEAVMRFETVLRLNPGFMPAHRRLGFALAKSGRTKEAVSHYEQYIRAVPDDAEAMDELRQLRAVGVGPR